MRTYTNFDLWNTLKFHRGLGKMEYKGRVLDSDEGADILRLAIELQLDGIISISHCNKDLSGDKPDDDTWSLQFKLLGALEGMNTKPDGQPNNMQLGTVMLNLNEAGILKRITPQGYPL